MNQLKKALIIVDHGSVVEEANNLLVTIANLLLTHSENIFDIIKISHMELANPTIQQAFDECVSDGAKEITIYPYFLVPGRHSKTDIPMMAKEAALKHPDIKYKVTEPLGIHEKILDIILERAKEISD